MKNAKRFISMLLAVVMVFSVGSFELATVVTGSTKLNKAQGGTEASPQASYSYAINSYLQGTTTPIIPAVTGTVTTSGYQLIAIAQIVPGYVLTPFESSPVRLTLTEPMTYVNFYYVAKKYTLSFQSNGGTSVDSITQSYKTTILKPSEPIKAGYLFTGWFLDGTLTHPVTWPYAMPLNGGTLFAGWILAPVTLTFNSNNGTPISPVTASPGTLVQKPLNPTRNYYRFDGWFADISYVQPVSWPLTMPAAASTIYAKWTYVRYTITFNSTGGTSVGSIPAQPGDDVYPPDDPAKTGYSFDGWYYDNGTFANPVEWPMTMGDIGITLFAKWSPITITINFNSDGGSAMAPFKALADSSITAPEPPRKFGYVFAGWELNGSAYIFTTMPIQDITLVATWNASQRSAQVGIKTYKMVNGVLVLATSARAGDEIYAVVTPKTNFYCGSSKYVLMYDSSFYTIVGSGKTAITPNASNAYYANAVASYSGQTNNLLSQWPTTFVGGESSRYMYVAATFASNSKAPNGGYPLMISDTTSLFTVKLKVKDDATGSGNIFMDKKWDRSSTFNGTGASYFFYCTSGSVLSSSGISTVDFDTDYVDANKTITLDTSVPVYTNILFNTNGGLPIPAISGEAGTISSPPANPVREGYTFTNWLPAFPSVFPQTDLTIVAQWQINSYYAYFMVDGTQYAKIPTQYGAQIIKPANNPVKVGWTFVNWSPTVGIMGAKDQTFTAIFTINSYKANFYVDGIIYREVTTEYGAQIQAPSNPQKTGCNFTTWSPAVGLMGAADQRFDAQFSTNHYNAYFMVDSQIYDTVSTLYNTQIIAPAINPEKAGFEFKGWSPLVGIMGAGEQTFIAQWQSTTFNAYFKVDGEPYHTSVTTKGETIVLPNDPQKVGYTFNGWDFVPSPMPSNDVTINATWTINNYNVTFKVDGTTYDSKQT
ncbi:MAG: InlB B-repeat-containing protein, partial [Eubacteriales bacterium]